MAAISVRNHSVKREQGYGWNYTFGYWDKFLLQSRKADRKRYSNNTYVERITDGPDVGAIGIVLHRTRIITAYRDGTYRVNTGGYRTVTMKQRLREFLPGLGLCQKSYSWYWGDGREFRDGMLFIPANVYSHWTTHVGLDYNTPPGIVADRLREMGGVDECTFAERLQEAYPGGNWPE